MIKTENGQQKYISSRGYAINLDSDQNCLRAFHDRIASVHRDDLKDIFNSDSVNYDNEAKGLFVLSLTKQLPKFISRTGPKTNSDELFKVVYDSWWGVEKLKSTFIDYSGQSTANVGDDDVNYMSVKYRQEDTTFATYKLGIHIEREVLEANMVMIQSGLYRGINLTRDVQIVTNRQFAEDYHRVAMFGDDDHRIHGLFKHPSTPEEVDTVFLPYGTDTTRAESYNWTLKMLETAYDQVKYYGSFDTVLFPQKHVMNMMKVDSMTNVDVTAWQLVLDNFRSLGVTNIGYLPELNESSLVANGVLPTGKAMILFYNRDEMCLERYCSYPRTIDESPKNSLKLIFEQKVSGINWTKPLESLKVIYNTALA